MAFTMGVLTGVGAVIVAFYIANAPVKSLPDIAFVAVLLFASVAFLAVDAYRDRYVSWRRTHDGG